MVRRKWWKRKIDLDLLIFMPQFSIITVLAVSFVMKCLWFSLGLNSRFTFSVIHCRRVLTYPFPPASTEQVFPSLSPFFLSFFLGVLPTISSCSRCGAVLSRKNPFGIELDELNCVWVHVSEILYCFFGVTTVRPLLFSIGDLIYVLNYTNFLCLSPERLKTFFLRLWWNICCKVCMAPQRPLFMYLWAGQVSTGVSYPGTSVTNVIPSPVEAYYVRLEILQPVASSAAAMTALKVEFYGSVTASPPVVDNRMWLPYPNNDCPSAFLSVHCLSREQKGVEKTKICAWTFPITEITGMPFLMFSKSKLKIAGRQEPQTDFSLCTLRRSLPLLCFSQRSFRKLLIYKLVL